MLGLLGQRETANAARFIEGRVLPSAAMNTMSIQSVWLLVLKVERVEHYAQKKPCSPLQSVRHHRYTLIFALALTARFAS